METIKELYVLGLGRNTPVFLDIAEQSGYAIKGLYHYNDDLTGTMQLDYEVLGSYDNLFSGSLQGKAFLLTMGDNDLRHRLAEKIRACSGATPAIIHPMAVISRFAEVGQGVIVSPFSYIQANTTVGDDTVILSHVNISHNNLVGKACFFAGGAILGAYTNVSDKVFVGIGAKIISDKVEFIGEKAYIGAGSLVTKSVSANTLVKGVPAKEVLNK